MRLAESAFYRIERQARRFSDWRERQRLCRSFDAPIPDGADLRQVRVAAAVKAVCPHFDALVDVGAHRGRFAQVLCSFWAFDHIVCVEPDESLHAELSVALAGRATIHSVALGPRPGQTAFFIHPNKSMSSLKPVESGTFVSKFPYYRTDDIRSQELTVQTLDWLLSQDGLERRRDILLKLDTQGSELEILRSGGKRLPHVSACIVEHMFWGGYRQVPEARDLLEFMHASAFTCRGVVDLTFRCSGEPACADFLFTRRQAPAGDGG
jgi:FkbM family methyltransferase